MTRSPPSSDAGTTSYLAPTSSNRPFYGIFTPSLASLCLTAWNLEEVAAGFGDL